VNSAIVTRLYEAGHDVLYVAEIAPAIADTDILDLANQEKRLLLTSDKDFGELTVRHRRSVPGLLLLRLPTVPPMLSWLRLNTAIGAFGNGLFGRYTVIQRSRIRSRPLPH
jgi:predicted nuclease of predicted toxin-antitoxin system